MSAGRVHMAASLALATPTALALGIATQRPLVGLLAGCGCVLGVVVSPDLDIDQRTISENIWPEPLATMWYVYWWIYAKLLKHRSFWSHAPVIGTALRIAYGFWWLPLVKVPPVSLWPIWVGLAASDLAHWIMDVL